MEVRFPLHSWSGSQRDGVIVQGGIGHGTTVRISVYVDRVENEHEGINIGCHDLPNLIAVLQTFVNVR